MNRLKILCEVATENEDIKILRPSASSAVKV